MGCAEIIAVLNPRTCRFDIGSGGQSDFDWSNIAGALGHCSAGAAMTARAIWLHDPASIRQLIGRAMGVTMRWQLSMEQRHALCTRIVKESIVPDYCDTCGGRGEAMIAEVKCTCPACHGTGRKRSDWSKLEAPAVDAVQSVISMWLGEAQAAMGRERDD